MRNLVLVLLLLISSLAFSQKTTATKTAGGTSSTVETYKKAYYMALRCGDAQAAVNSLYLIIAEEGDLSPYKDSLLLMYFDMASFVQCERVATELVKTYADSIEKGKKLTQLEILAISQASLGKVKEAIESFDKLLSKTNEMYHAYRLAELQYTYKRVGEALQSTMRAENLTNSMKAPVKLEVEKNKVQEVKLEAAVLNLKGYILLEEYPDKKAEAIAAFTKALEIQPDFILAKNNLAYATGSKPQGTPENK